MVRYWRSRLTNHSVLPETILPDGVDSASFNGKIVRKGTIAAFLANVELLDNPQIAHEQKQEAIATLKSLASAVNSTGLHKHVIFKNSTVEQILTAAESDR